MTALARPLRASLPLGPLSIVVGIAGAVALLGLYLGIISLAQGIDHALEQLATDVLFVALVAVGFGIQVGMFAELRTLDRRHRASAAVTAVGTGTSTVAMLACCAHHLVDLLPIIGLSAAAVFLEAYKVPLLVAGIGMNAIGIIVVARQLTLHFAQNCVVQSQLLHAL